MADKNLFVGEKEVSLKHKTGADTRDNSDTFREWNCTPEQAEKHIATWNDAALGALKITKGDESAIKDAANEYRKQRNS